MDSELEELESILSGHFGRTPVNTPGVSQIDSDSTESEVDSTEGTHDLIATGARDFLHSSGEVHGASGYASDIRPEDSSTDGDDDGSSEIHYDRDSCAIVDDDLDKIKRYKTARCCKLNCCEKFPEDQFYEYLLNIQEMYNETKEVFIMGLMNGNSSEKTKRGKKRMRARRTLTFMGTVVCKKTFLICHDIGKKSFSTLNKHISCKGLVPRQHGNTGRKPHNALNYEDVQRVVRFLSNWADEKGIPQPAAPKGRDGIPPIYLSSDCTKVDLHSSYKKSCFETDPLVKHVSLAMFKTLWSSCVPHIKIANPRDDVCATCERMRKVIMDSVAEEDKLLSLANMRQHIEKAQKEREMYNDCVKRSVYEESYHHFTFDFSQNVSLPHHSRQMGPLYFLSLRKVQIFGVRIDGIPLQLNFLVDENETIGQDGTGCHGPNSVISMVDWTLKEYGSGAVNFSIHSDNCPGQNKNKYMLGYFMWRVMTGHSETIEFLMQIPGHARCLVDAGFAHIKRVYRRTDTETLDQLENIVNKSSKSNLAIRYQQWSWRNWKVFQDRTFKPLKGIRSYQYFRFSATEPGIVAVRPTGADSLHEEKFCILKDPAFQFPNIVRPDELPAGGLSDARKSYLHRSVRPFVRPAFQDELCPL